MLVDGRPTAAGRDHENALANERLNDRELPHANGRRTSDDSPQVSMAISLHQMSLGLEVAGAFGRQRASDELGRMAKRRIRRIDLDLRDDGGHTSGAVRTTQGVLERLLDHVADPSGR